ncbi:TPA: transporter substrate-binding domain-containing protein [Klebsiella pneumoniae]
MVKPAELAGASPATTLPCISTTIRLLAVTSSNIMPKGLLGIYVAKGNTELAEAIKATLAALKANGQYAALIKKYNLESID